MGSDKLLEIFAGNEGVVGADNGGCLRLMQGVGAWERLVLEHFDRGDPIGVYPVSNGQVKWGCVDWDNGPSDITHAFNVKRVIDKIIGEEYSTWVEASRSKGFHLWWFIDGWVDMAEMRRALLAACELVDAPTREVNPKQFELEPDQVGNYVRLPYPGGRMGEPRPDTYLSRTMYMQYDMGDAGVDAVGFGEFLFHVTPAKPQLVSTVAQYYVPPVRVQGRYTPLPGAPAAKLSGLARKMFHEGPLNADDRSSQIYRFARLLVEGQRHTPEEVTALVLEFDEGWFDPPKYVGRPDCERRVEGLVQRVFDEGVEPNA